MLIYIATDLKTVGIRRLVVLIQLELEDETVHRWAET